VSENRRQVTKHCFALAALAAMVTWFCDEMIFSGKIPFFRDLASYFYPIKFSVAEAFKAGELPLWDRRMAAGFPIMAGFQSAVFYPPSIAYFLLPFFAAVQFTFVFHYAVAASGSYVLFRSWKYPVYVSVVGATLFSFGGVTVSLTNLLNHFQSAVWLPWLIYFWERTVKIERWSALVVFSVVSLCQLLAGSPEIFVFSVGLVVLDTVRMYSEGECRGFCRKISVLLGAGLIIIGLGMVQLLPTAELIFQSRRDHPIPASEALAWSLKPSSLIGLLMPTAEADASLSLGVRLLFGEGLPFLLGHYMGIIAVFSLCSWFVTARMKERMILSGLLGLSLLCAFGSSTPLYPLLYKWVPVFGVIRFPEKFYYLTYALLVFATVRGLRKLTDGENFRVTSIIVASIIAGWITGYVAFRWDTNLLSRLIHPVQLVQPVLTVDPTTIATILFGLEKQIAISTLLAGILLLNQLQLLRPLLLQSLLVLVVFVDLGIANKPLHFLRQKEVIKNAVRVLDKPPAHHSRLFYYPPGSHLHPSFVSVSGNPSHEKATELALNNLLPNAGSLYGFEYFQDIDALGRRSYTDFLNFINSLPPEQRGRLLRVLNVKYVVSFHPLEVKGLRLVREFPEHYSRLYEVRDTMPRTYVVSQATHDRDAMNTLRRISGESFDPMREVILDAPINLKSKTDFSGEAAIKLYQNNRVEIAVRLSEPGILVLTDVFYPGWKVFVGGKEQKVLRANYFFRGVELPAGNQMVEFIYEPESFKLGLSISLLTAGLLVIVPLVGLFRGKVRFVNSKREAPNQPANFAAE
jgi:Bacterial membrane protein YfhO